MEKLEITIYSYNKEDVGTLAVTDEGIDVSLTGGKHISIPAAAVRSATSLRIGKVAQSIYALRIFLKLPEALKIREETKKLELCLLNGKQLQASAICNATGEHVEFFVNATDVMGYDLKEKPKVRQIIDRINGVGTPPL